MKEKWKNPKSAPENEELIVLTQANQIMTALYFSYKQYCNGRIGDPYWTIQIYDKKNILIETVPIETPKKWKYRID